MVENNSKIISDTDSLIMAEESIAEYLAWEKEKGLSPKMLRQIKGQVTAFYRWLPEEKCINKEILLEWRRDMHSRNYTEGTILSYVKSINRYLDYVGHFHLRFNRGRAYDLTNMQFGYLTALEPSKERSRKNVIWICECKCGNICEVPAARLISAHTRSCGCLKAETLGRIEKYIDGTSLHKAMKDRAKSDVATSGYVGVTERRGGYRAQIHYKGKYFYLGDFSEIEDAVKARSVAKQLVQKDAAKLLEVCEYLHKGDIKLSSTPASIDRSTYTSEDNALVAKPIRCDNKSGCTGVFKRRGKWTAKITYNKKSYILGNFLELEDAVAARKKAEQLIEEDPQYFVKTLLYMTTGDEGKK